MGNRKGGIFRSAAKAYLALYFLFFFCIKYVQRKQISVTLQERKVSKEVTQCLLPSSVTSGADGKCTAHPFPHCPLPVWSRDP